MYPTYEQIKKVSQDPTLTPSQKMHEVFKNSKTTPLKKYIEDSSTFSLFVNNEPLDPSVRVDEAEVV